jgi:hypothetical protein
MSPGAVAVVRDGRVHSRLAASFPPVAPSLASVCIGPVSQGSDLVVCQVFLM